MPFELGDVLLVPFPFTDQSASKHRPAVVASSTTYASERIDVVVMPITSQLRPSPVFGEVWLDDWGSAGLLRPSAVKPVLATLEQRLVIRPLGALSTRDRSAVRMALDCILGR